MNGWWAKHNNNQTNKRVDKLELRIKKLEKQLKNKAEKLRGYDESNKNE